MDAGTGRGAGGSVGAVEEAFTSWLAVVGGGGGIAITAAPPALALEGGTGDPFDPPPDAIPPPGISGGL